MATDPITDNQADGQPRRRRSDCVDLSGRRFGRLTALHESDSPKHWVCECDCGGRTRSRKSDLLGGHARSCGCYRDERRNEAKTTHGMSGGRLYGIWCIMRTRCGAIGKKHAKHVHYKDKGVRVCPEWTEAFEPFRDWSLANGYDDALTIDRIDNSKGYEPGNCRWITLLDNLRNRTTSRLTLERARDIKARLAVGKRGIAKALASEFGVSEQTICDIKKGRIWPDA